MLMHSLHLVIGCGGTGVSIRLAGMVIPIIPLGTGGGGHHTLGRGDGMVGGDLIMRGMHPIIGIPDQGIGGVLTIMCIQTVVLMGVVLLQGRGVHLQHVGWLRMMWAGRFAGVVQMLRGCAVILRLD